MKLPLPTLRIAGVVTILGAALHPAPLAAQDAPQSRLLSPPSALEGTCAVTRVGLAAAPRDSNTVRTLVITNAGKEARRIAVTEDGAGRLLQVSDVLLTSLENVDVRFAGRPRVSWHTTEDSGMPDSAAVIAAQRLAELLKRRCPVR